MPHSIGKVYSQMIEEYKGETKSNYGFIPLIANTSKFNIGCLNTESNNERTIYVGNDVVTEGNMLLSDDVLFVLQINSYFMEFMQYKCSNFSRQKFIVNIVRSDGEE